MNKKFYWIGLPICFICLAGSTYLIPKTYESTFVIAKETEQAVEHNRVMTLNHPENYDLGLIRTDNMLKADTYSAIIGSDKFLQGLLNIQVRTLDGSFEGSYTDYYLKDRKVKEEEVIAEDAHIHWKSKEQEIIKSSLAKSINAKMDYETRLVTVSCSAPDPLVATMIAENVKEQLRKYIETYQQEKMRQTLAQLNNLTAQAKADWEQDKSKDKEAIYKSFARQEVVYKAQMVYSPAFAVVAEPSFSYRKVAPSRWKMPLAITLLLGIGIWCWDNRKKLVNYI